MSMKKFMTLALATSFALSFSALQAADAQPAEAPAKDPMEETLQKLNAELDKAAQVGDKEALPVGEEMPVDHQAEPMAPEAVREENNQPMESVPSANAESTNPQG